MLTRNVPMFLVVHSPFQHNKKASHGIIIRSLSTGRWLVVRSKDSCSKVSFCRGTYHRSRVPGMAKRMSLNEIEEVLSSSHSLKAFKSMCEKVDESPIDYVVEYAYGRLLSVTDILEHALREGSRGNGVTYGFVKGKPENNETVFETAVRELREETGIVLGKEALVLNKTVTSVIYTDCNSRYQNSYVLCLINDEIAPSNRDKDEVSEALWLETNELEGISGQLIKAAEESMPLIH